MAQHIKIRIGNGLVIQFGESAFSGAGTTVEVPCPDLVEIVSATATPQSYTGGASAGGEVLFCDKTISSGQVTISRKANIDAGLGFSYILVGR